jgi:5-hydroxyisourate hydrolase
MSAITTHVLDTARGRPAEGIVVKLEVRSGDGWKLLGHCRTDANGRCNSLLPESARLEPGTYRLVFDVGGYFGSQQTETFYEAIPIVFAIRRPEAHYHVPLLVSPYGYSTYRGS